MNNEIFRLSGEVFGLVPPMMKEMASLHGSVAYNYVSGLKSLQQGKLDDREQNAIELKVSLLNSCQSCVRGHTYLLKKAGMPQEDITAILHNLLAADENINRLVAATELIYYAGRMGFPEFYVDKLEKMEVSKEVVVEIIGLISLKTISNYFNNYIIKTKTKQAV